MIKLWALLKPGMWGSRVSKIIYSLQGTRKSSKSGGEKAEPEIILGGSDLDNKIQGRASKVCPLQALDKAKKSQRLSWVPVSKGSLPCTIYITCKHLVSEGCITISLYTLRIFKASPTLQLPQPGTDTTGRPASSGSPLRTRSNWEIVLETGETALSRNSKAHSFTK